MGKQKINGYSRVGAVIIFLAIMLSLNEYMATQPGPPIDNEQLMVQVHYYR